MGQTVCCQKHTSEEYYLNKKNKITPHANGVINTGYDGGCPEQCQALLADNSETTKISQVRLRNFHTNKDTTDKLHKKAVDEFGCSPGICKGSKLWNPIPRQQRTQKRDKKEVMEQAVDFMQQYYSSLNKLNSTEHQKRVADITNAINQTGLYDMTFEELDFGARTAWRNAPRCIGRIQWNNLKLFDKRHVKTAEEMYEAVCEHLDYATNEGNIRPAITIFPPRDDVTKDFRVWNRLMVHFLGHKQPDGSVIGDPADVPITEVLKDMGWKPKKPPGRFDVAPLLVQANGEDPKYFDLPEHLALTVDIKHPDYDWFADMDLKWYAVPGVANMMFDVGGIEFPAAPFSGWFMGSEIGARDLCDESRFNVLQEVAEHMGLDTESNVSLWKDQALVEVNKAVLHSYQAAGVTLVDHHTASASFMQHLKNEQKLRGGCPADWVWIIPPLSASVTEVFHQEMLRYHLKPSYEYQEDPWGKHVWKMERMIKRRYGPKKLMTLKTLGKVILVTTSMVRQRIRKRKRALILYATETGRSKALAERVMEVKSYAFNCRIMCMDEYNANRLIDEESVYFVASTFGNGDAPTNGEKFYDQLVNWVQSIKNNSNSKQPLRKVSFSVFALGSTAYPNFCEFGKKLDSLMTELGAGRIYSVGTGDEMGGQEQSFVTWIQGSFKAALQTYQLRESDMRHVIERLSRDSDEWEDGKFRLVVKPTHDADQTNSLSKIHKMQIMKTQMIFKENLQAENSGRETILVKLRMDKFACMQDYEPGDHVGVFPHNETRLVEGIIKYISDPNSADTTYQVQRASKDTATGWRVRNALPATSLRCALTHYLDITTPLSQAALKMFARFAANPNEKEKLHKLALDGSFYEEWKSQNVPNLLEVFEEFPSLRVPIEFLMTQLQTMQPRLYSISSSLKMYPEEIHLTVAVVKFRTRNDTGPEHFGVASNWLNRLETGDTVLAYIRKSSFRLPEDPIKPVIMVGPGTGIAPYRSFWQERQIMAETQPETKFEEMNLYFGCRNRDVDFIYKDELSELESTLPFSVFVATSREPTRRKTYVQHLVAENASKVYRQICKELGYFYICGDITMAQDVQDALENILREKGKMSDVEVKHYIDKMKMENRLQKDLFGARSGSKKN